MAPAGNPVGGPTAGTVYELGEGVLERVATTEHPQPVLAVVRMRHVTLDVLRAATFVVVGDRIADPGNVGTILRSAEAAGAAGVVLTAGSVDLYSPKVIRSSAGAAFHLPVVTGVALIELRALGLRLLAASSHRGVPYTAADLTVPCALVVGNEAHGLPDDAPVDGWITIPHRGRAESLNVAMATAVLCFEVARQRTGGAGRLDG